MRSWEELANSLGHSFVQTKQREDMAIVMTALFHLLDVSRLADPLFDRGLFMRAFYKGIAAHADDPLPAYRN